MMRALKSKSFTLIKRQRLPLALAALGLHKQEFQLISSKVNKRERSTFPLPFASPLGWGATLTGMVGFCLVAYDVFDPSSQHLLQEVDLLGHTLSQSLDSTTRSLLYGKIFSEAAISAGISGWVVLTWSMVSNLKIKEDARPAKVLGVAWLFYAFLAGKMHQDPWLVMTLKEIFHRSRPSPILSSMSFPSGHTTAATFIVASLLFVLIPMVLERYPGIVEHHQAKLKTLFQVVSWPLLLLATTSTAVGRILGDAHWASDTLAASFLGICMSSLLAQCAEAILNQEDKAQSKVNDINPEVPESFGSFLGKAVILQRQEPY